MHEIHFNELDYAESIWHMQSNELIRIDTQRDMHPHSVEHLKVVLGDLKTMENTVCDAHREVIDVIDEFTRQAKDIKERLQQLHAEACKRIMDVRGAMGTLSVVFRPFDESDWKGYAGAVMIEGCTPQIARGYEPGDGFIYDVVYDVQTFSIYRWRIGDTEENGEQWVMDIPWMEARARYKLFQDMGAKITTEHLMNLQYEAT